MDEHSEKNKPKALRAIKNAHHKCEITMLELSTYHNIFVTASHDNVIYIWDYEIPQLLGSIELDPADEPTCFEFINGFCILMIGTSLGEIYFLEFKIKNHIWEHFKIIGLISIDPVIKEVNFHINKNVAKNLKQR